MFGWWAKSPDSGIQLFNTAARKKEAFVPITHGAVKIYTCGPTVYDYATIGNFRSYVFADVLRRTLEYAGYRVTQVVNITDFGHLVSDADEGEDKMIKGLKREGLPLTMEGMSQLATKFGDAFKEDMASLNIETPHAMPRATEHVRGMIAYVDVLLHKGFAYKTTDGVYFDTQKFPHYGSLGGAASADHSRIGVSDEKHDPRDFAIWKFTDDPNMGWDAPWGRGFPGWHIECTAMSTQYLGKSFDIHTGGIDHIAIHHNNEIAQAEAANNKPYARYWMHNEFITIDNARIGKSQGNQILLRQLRDRNVSPLAYRYWLLTGHYRSQMNFTWDAVEASQTALHRALRTFADLRGNGSVLQSYAKRFEDALYDDLDTPKAIAILWELIKDESVKQGDKRATILDFDRVLGIGFSFTELERRALIGSVETESIPKDIQELMQKREEARKNRDFHEADTIRDELKARGYAILDGADGPTLTRISGVVR